MTMRRQQGAKRPAVPESSELGAVEAEPLQIERAERGKVRDSASARALAKLPRATRTMCRKVMTSEQFAVHNRNRIAYVRATARSLAMKLGDVPPHAAAMVEGAGWCLAFANLLAERGAAVSAPNLDEMKVMAQLLVAARQNAIAAQDITESFVKMSRAKRSRHAGLMGVIDGEGVDSDPGKG